jgi:hypothetical protein
MKKNIFKDSLLLLKENIMIIQPLLFWVLILVLVLVPLVGKNTFDLGFLFSSIIAILCMLVFLAGWFYCIKYTINNKSKVYATPEERNNAQFEILKSFFPGVAEYILPVSGGFIVFLALSYGIFNLFRFVAKQVYISQNMPTEFINVLNTGTQIEITKYIQTGFSHEQIIVLYSILAVGLFIYVLFELCMLWFAPALLYSSKNPFIALYKAVKFSFNHIGTTISIFLVMFLINSVISVLNTLCINSFLSFIPMLLTFFYIVYYVVTIFLYYEQTENNSDIGGNLDRQI